MLFALGRNWQFLALRGLATIIFGVLAIAIPDITLAFLIVLFGLYALAASLLSGIIAFSERPYLSKALLAAEAIAGVFSGVFALIYPELTAVSLLYLLGAWALVTGGLRIASAVLERESGGNAWLLGINGLIVAVLGLMVASSPSVGALVAMWTIGAMAIAFGLTEAFLAFRLRHLSARKSRLWTIRSEELREKIEKK